MPKRNLPVNKPRSEWTLDDGLAVIQHAIDCGPTQEGYAANLDYVQKRDHWQNGREWKGPRGTPDTEQIILDAVEPQFTPVDTLNECLDTLADGLLERNPSVGFGRRIPLPAVMDQAARATAERRDQERTEHVVRQLRAWRDKRKLGDLERSVVKRVAYAGYATLRPWLPASQLDSVEVPSDDPEAPPRTLQVFPTGLTLEEAFDRIYASAPEADVAVVWEDPETHERTAIFAYCFENKEYLELWWVDREPAGGGTAQTHQRVLSEGRAPEDAVLQLGGRLPFVQLDGEMLVTDSVRRQQARFNFFESLLVRVAETAGFPERYTINAESTGIYLETPPSEGPALKTVEEDGKLWYLHPMERTLGPSVVTDLVGVATKDPETGALTVATPSVERFEPVDPENILKSCQHAKQTIRQECKQGHVEMDGEATSSGWSRVQARARFVSDLMKRRNPLAVCLGDFYEGLLALASQMTNELDGFLDTYDCQVTVYISPGPVDPEERSAINEQVAKGLLSLETALVMLGIEDVAAELDRIRNSPDAQLARLEKQFTVIAAMTTAGLRILTAAKIVGLAPEHLTLIEADANAVPTLEDGLDEPDDTGDRRAA